MARRSQLAVGLDAGSVWTRIAVLALQDGAVTYAGHGCVPSRGWHKGVIADQSAVADSVRAAIREAEAACGEPIASAVVGVGGPSIRCQQARGLYEFGTRRPIERGDLQYAIDLASRARLDEDRFLLQVCPQDFTVDGRPPLAHPLNIDCQRLEAHALLVTCSAQEHQALVSAIHQAHLKVDETVFESMAAAYASVFAEERSGGVSVFDVGGQSSQVVYYDGDSMLYAIGMPVSGDHFTRDIGECKALSFDEAERIKFAHGCALVGLSSDNIIIELPAEAGRPGREISRRELTEILEARATQAFKLVERFRVQGAHDVPLREGVVLVGGGCLLEGMVDVAERILGCPARLGFPRGVANWPEELNTPLWTTAAGLGMYSAKLQTRKEKSSRGISFWSLFTGKQ